MKAFLKIMMAGLMVVTAGAVLVATTSGVGKITGHVCDDGGNPIAGATVMIQGTTMGAASSIDGSYTILNVPTGTYTLFAASIGFNKMTVTDVKVIADSSMAVDFTLSAAAVQTMDIIVSAEEPSIDKYVMGSEFRKTMPISKVDNVLHARGGRAGEISYMADGAVIPPQLVGNVAPASGPYDHRFGTETYGMFYENGFLDVKDNPLSTFSIDVDAASYSNSRRFINQGSLPPKDAVRIEEFINYFDYDYPQPNGDKPFSITAEIASCPWQEEHRLLHIGIQGKNIPLDDLPPSNLVFLIDVSGSMQPDNKLPLLKSAFRMLAENLRKNDRVAIVVYAGAAGLVLPSTQGSETAIIIDAIDRLHSGGTTAGGAGLRLAYKTAYENFIKGGNNRVILATDGDFNVGVSSDAEMVRLIEEEREKGIFITVLGFGQGNIKDSKMEQIADKGNGNYFYIDGILEARKALITEMGGTLFTIAKDVKIQIEFNPAKIQAYRLVGYENRLLNKEDFNDDKKDAGEIGSAHSVTALYELIPASLDIALPPVNSVDPLKYQTNRLKDAAYESNEALTLKIRYKKPDGNKSSLLEQIAVDAGGRFDETSENFRFSAAVAEFGMLLRESEFKGNSSYDEALSLANQSIGEDREGYRKEFVRLVEACKSLPKQVSEK